jgi:hypothetical protein
VSWAGSRARRRHSRCDSWTDPISEETHRRVQPAPVRVPCEPAPGIARPGRRRIDIGNLRKVFESVTWQRTESRVEITGRVGWVRITGSMHVGILPQSRRQDFGRNCPAAQDVPSPCKPVETPWILPKLQPATQRHVAPGSSLNEPDWRSYWRWSPTAAPANSHPQNARAEH